MTPIQVWLPRFSGGIARPHLRRDMQRAFRLWDGECVVWTMPEWSREERWNEHSGRPVLGIPGDCLERISVAHVGENRKLVCPDVPETHGYTLDRLLDLWLNGDAPGWEPVPADDQITTTVPVVEDGEVFVAEVMLEAESSGWLPIAGAAELTDESSDARVALLRWPPDANAPLTVSPETESAELSPNGRHPPRSLPVRQVWPSPFTGMMPHFSSPDDLYARDLMRGVALQSHEDLQAARARAATEAQPWLSSGWSTVMRTWFEPILAKEGESGALLAAEYSRYGLRAESLADALQRPEWRDILRRRVTVRRAWGVPGLMWALLLDALNASMPFKVCKRCGRLIRGRSNKENCARDDNPACYRARKNEDRRRARQAYQ